MDMIEIDGHDFQATVYIKLTVDMCIWISLLIFDCVLTVVVPRLQTVALNRAIGIMSAGQVLQTSLGR